MSAPHSTSPDGEGFDRDALSQEGADAIDQRFDGLGSALVVEHPEAIEAASQIAVDLNAEPIDAIVVQVEDPACVVENNVFKDAFGEAVSVEAHVLVPESVSIVVHGNRLLSADDSVADGGAESMEARP